MTPLQCDHVEQHSADGRTCIRKVKAGGWEVWHEDVLQGIFRTREEARVFIRGLKLPGFRLTRWDLIMDDAFLAHLPEPA